MALNSTFPPPLPPPTPEAPVGKGSGTGYTTEKSAAGEAVWKQIQHQFVWVLIAQAIITAACALLYTPISLTLARTARGDMLLPEPKRVQGVKASGANGMQRLGDEDEGEGDSEEDDGGELHAAGGEEQFGRKLRRLLELYVGSEDTPPFDTRFMLGLHLMDLFLSLLTVLFWIVKSYKRHIDKAFIGAEFLFAIFFAAFYLLRLLRARLRPWATFSASSLVDVVTFVPLFLQATHLRTWLNFSYGRALCALWAFEALEAAGAVDNLNDVRRRLVLFVLRFVALVISFAGTMYVFEVLGDPGGISDSFVHAEMGDISVYQMCYFVFVTVSTVGYGDFTPRTLLGRAFTVLIILSGVAFFSVETAELLAISSSEASGKGRFHPKRRQQGHVLVAGGALTSGGPTGTLADFLRELCIPRPGVVPPEVVLLCTELSCGQEERPREDEAAVLAAAALHRAHPSLRLRLLLCEARSLALAAQVGLPTGSCVTAADVSPRLVGLAGRTPGAATLVVNLLRGAPSARAPGPGAAPPAAWMTEYSHGASQGVFGAPLGQWASQLPFHTAAASLYARHGVTLLAVQRHGRVLLAPAQEASQNTGESSTSSPCLLAPGDIAFVVAHDAATVAHALQSPRGADWRALFHARREEAARADEARVRMQRARRRTAALAEALAAASQQQEAASEQKAEMSNPGADAAPQTAAHAAHLHLVPVRFRTKMAMASRQRSVGHVVAAGGHVIIVLLSPTPDGWADAEQVLACLRAPHMPVPLPALVLAPSAPPAGWAAHFGGCPMVVGDPLQLGPLAAAGCATASRVVVLAGEPAHGLVDRAGVVAATVLERTACALWSRDPEVILELHAPSDLAYLPPRLPSAAGASICDDLFTERSRQLDSAAQRVSASVPPGLHARFASGRATFRTDVGRLLGAELVTPGLMDLFRSFVDPQSQGQQSALWCVPLPLPLPGGEGRVRTFGALFAALCTQGVLPLGLWRVPKSARRRATSGESTAGYVVTAPPAWLPLHTSDWAFVLATTDWGRVHCPEFAAIKRVDAAIVIQSHWRLHRARRGAAKRHP